MKTAIRLLAAAIAATALAACGVQSSQAPPAATGPKVSLTDFAITPTTLTGTTFHVVNEGRTPHNLWIRDSTGKVIAKSKDLAPGESTEFTFTAAPGTYVAYCQEPGHESLGMKATLTVS